MPLEKTQVNERARVGKVCTVCDMPYIGDDCECTGVDYRRHLDVLYAEFPADRAARAVRRASGRPDPCVSEHAGPWAVVSRHGTAAPHAQCAACGHIDRTGDIARELED